MSEDILERAKALYLPPSERQGCLVIGMIEILPELIAEVERLRSLENCVSLVIDRQGKTNAAQLGQLDVISAYLDAELVEWKNGDQIAEIAIKFMDLQKQKLNDANSQTAAKDARIDLLDSDQKRYHAAWMAAEEDKEEQAARIKELQDLIDKPPEEADWVADYHLSTYQNASGNA